MELFIIAIVTLLSLCRKKLVAGEKTFPLENQHPSPLWGLHSNNVFSFWQNFTPQHLLYKSWLSIWVSQEKCSTFGLWRRSGPYPSRDTCVAVNHTPTECPRENAVCAIVVHSLFLQWLLDCWKSACRLHAHTALCIYKFVYVHPQIYVPEYIIKCLHILKFFKGDDHLLLLEILLGNSAHPCAVPKGSAEKLGNPTRLIKFTVA